LKVFIFKANKNPKRIYVYDLIKAQIAANGIVTLVFPKKEE